MTSNLLDTNWKKMEREEESTLALELERPTSNRLLDNLLMEYAGKRYRYDRRGNLVEKMENGVRTRYVWNASNQLVRVE
ncbi:MAG: hypothetical protein LBI31_00355, partial [Zoogloeaceae bacterium]|nr:hypothetical protein [Zoogloeaceae bacterium]